MNRTYINKVKKCSNFDVIGHANKPCANVMKNSTLLVCRAGATTLSEITAMGMPAIIIPSPYVPNNHQYYNGKALVDNDAAIMIEEKDLTADLLYKKVSDIINDDNRLKELSNNAKKLGLTFKVDVLKYPHHGNATLDGNFLREINPQYVIVPNNGYGYGPTSANNIKNTSGATIYCLNGKNGCDNAPKTNNIIVHSDGNTVTVEN